MTTKTVYDLKENCAVVMPAIDANHAVLVDPKRWSFTPPAKAEPEPSSIALDFHPETQFAPPPRDFE